MLQNQLVLDVSQCEKRAELYNAHFTQKQLASIARIDMEKNGNENLEALALVALESELPLAYTFVYRPVFLDLVGRWAVSSDKNRSSQVADVMGQVVGVYPETVTLCDYFLENNHQHLNLILEMSGSQPESALHAILMAYYRFLHYDRDRFARFVSPTALYKILQGVFANGAIKLLAVQVLSMYLNMAEQATLNLSHKYTKDLNGVCATYDGDSEVDYGFLELNEAQRLSKYHTLLKTSGDSQFDGENLRSKDNLVINPQDLSPLIVVIYGVLVPRIRMNSKPQVISGKQEFVPTKEALSSMRALSKCIQLSKPVMLIGKAGSGKTFLIDQLSKYTGANDSMVKIHLGEQTDAKLLLGTYTSGEKPGTFEWRAGVLTTAVKQGRWVLIEDIDKAPTEVISVLLTLLEQRQLSIPSRGETIKAANGFQLISTIRIPDNDHKDEMHYKPDLIGIRLWGTVNLKDPSDQELADILRHKYPSLSNLVARFIATFNSVRNIYSNSQFISLNRGVHPRVVTVRDLVKFCSRVETIFQKNSIQSSEQLIPSHVYDSIFFEAADCFACAIGEFRALKPLIEAIGVTLEIPASRVNLYISKHVPAFEEDSSSLTIGRATLAKNHVKLLRKSANDTSFARTNHSLRLMEQIGASIQMCEPVLLVGETGTGKTTVVQQIAKAVNQKLTVINVSQQTESGDLLGGFKPVNTKTIAIPLLEDFESLFPATFSMKKNERFYTMLHKCFNKNQWKNVVKLLNEAFKLAKNLLNEEQKSGDDDNQKKKRKLASHQRKSLMDRWVEFHQNVANFEAQYSSIENSFVFNFVEGSLVKAVRNGEWLLLDEVNLASSDTLESISDLLSEPSSRSVLLSEKGQAEPVKAHPNFRIFACMNPATDVGKRDLPAGVRSRFTEIYVHSPDRDITDLLSIIDKYIGVYSVSDEWVGNDVAELYLEAKRLAEGNKVVDGSNQKPHFSIRTLTRTLMYVRDIVKIYGLRRSLYEGFCMSFLTLLNEKSEGLLRPLIEKFTLGRLKNPKSVVSQSPACPGPEYVQFKHYWMKKGLYDIQEQPNYIITPFVEKNMLNLVRATSGRRFPVLIQGPTSAGKTSMIKYLADITGHKFVRINNHEHTDLQEYLGTYMADDTGKLSFREGVLVDALRKGHWIVLDELNLAPTDVLEALNRLLDDNRELFIPETQEVIHPHPDFMLFATQNPPGIYGGRKILSRAFRNRFLELHFDDIPQDELEVILRERCKIAPSYALKIVEVYRQLSLQRSAMRLFEQKNSFATLRDLFRWALRDAVGYENLAANGYMLLAERCRNQEEREVVKAIIEKVMKVKLDMNAYYESLENMELQSMPSSIVWTKAMRKLAVLVSTCLKNNEPVLLVGETGCGKTTICQLIARYVGRQLITVNAHQNTETGDILGAQRPNRHRSDLQGELTEILTAVLNLEGSDRTLEELFNLFEMMDKSLVPPADIERIKKLKDNLNILFEWCDGPLVQALNGGEFFLLDEISLADDSVLERLNSVLEPERSLLLAEKGGSDSLIEASDGFQFFATMNPGGDYGKKELSPALRNRFTEIWVPSMEDFEDVQLIVSSKVRPELSSLAAPIVKFSKYFGEKFGGGTASNGVISLRDILSWVEFVNLSAEKLQNHHASLVQGAAMVFIDTLGTNNTAYLADSAETLKAQKLDCVKVLGDLTGYDLHQYYQQDISLAINEASVAVGMFTLERTSLASTPQFNLNAPTTLNNLMRVARAMQVRKPILLEGSPGVGKTSLISALSDCTGNKLTRINLSEQTDLIDLFGSDAPGERTGEFVWRDAPFLRAMQLGEWVLLDEMNLASQSVLEGLNACLDHRGEAYVPELDKSFTKHPNFMVFAAQNPQHQGGGRKGLPKSFVNRFSVVYIDVLNPQDLFLIATHLFPGVDTKACSQLIEIISTLEKEVSVLKLWGHAGSPWEFNLRDTLRWLKLLVSPSFVSDRAAVDYLDMILMQRFRTDEDRSKVKEVFERFFGTFRRRQNYFQSTPGYLQVNGEIIARDVFVKHTPLKGLMPLQCNTHIYESVVRCVNLNWPLVLCGPTNSGKTEIIRYVSGMLGTKVVSFPMNSDVDSMDILGGYEQVDLNRKVAQAVGRLTTILRQLIAMNISSEESESDAKVAALELFLYISNQTVDISNLEHLLGLINNVKDFVDNPDISSVSSELQGILDKRSNEASVTFEWFDGLLLKAMEEGSWLVLENANLCSPSVLDRLNSLLETDGTLIINECSHEDGQPRVMNPNPNFRLFLTVDPKYGELSRAMRNRSIEVYVDKLTDRATSFDRAILEYELPLGSIEYDKTTTAISAEAHSYASLSHFVSADKSITLQYANLHDICSAAESNVLESVVSILPTSAFPNLRNWGQNIMKSRYFNDKNTVEKFVSLAEYLQESGVFHKLSELSSEYEGLVPGLLHDCKSFAQNQPLIPSLNPYASRGLSLKHQTITSSEPAYLFEIIRLLHSFVNELDSVSRRAQHVKLGDLNYLELCAAHDQGRMIKKTPQIPIFEVLTLLSNHILKSVRSAKLFSIPDFYKSYFDLCSLWIAAFETSKTHNYSKLRVYEELLHNWQQETPLDGEKSQEILQIAESLGRSLSLETGRSMTLIWDAFRQSFPTSESAWKKLEKLLSVAKQFDSIVEKQFSDSYELIDRLRDTILDLKTSITFGKNSDFEDVIATLESGVHQLNSISERFLNQRKHYFKANFDALLRVVCHDGSDRNLVAPRIASYTSLSTETLLDIKANSYSYPAVFDLLWNKNDGVFESLTASVFDSSVLDKLLHKVVAFKHVSGSQITQALEDASVLQQNLVQFSRSVIADKVCAYKEALVEWYRKLVSLHVDVKSSSTLGDIQSLVSLSEDEWFKTIHERFLLAAIASTLNSTSLVSLGRAWILFSVGAMQLFAPNSPFDPAVHDYVLYDNFMVKKSLSQELSRSWESCRNVLSGDDPMEMEVSIANASDVQAPSKPKVYRPQETIDPLFEEWEAFMKSTVGAEPVERLLNSLDRFDSMSHNQLNLFQQNSSQFLERLISNYRVYSDLNEIFRGYVLGLKFGFDLFKQGKAEETKSLSLSPLWTIDALILTNPQQINLSFAELQVLFKNKTVASLNVERASTFYLKLFSFHGKDLRLLDTFESALQTLYYRWSMRRLHDEKEANSQVGVYKFDDSEIDVESDFRKLFPDFEDVLFIDGEKPQQSSNENGLDEIYLDIAKAYLNIFNDNAHRDLPDVVREGSKIADALEELGVEYKNCAPNSRNLTSVLNLLAQEIKSFQTPKNVECLDFYRDSSVFETKKAIGIVEKLWISVNDLLKRWPEHSTLSDLFRVCNEFMEYPGSTPIARLLQKIEQIFTIVTEWEKYASVTVSLQNSLRDLTDLVVSWRKLELRTWNSLFDYEDRSINKTMGKWWFHLFETIMVTVSEVETSDDNCFQANAKLLVSLNVFLSKCTYGEFSSRLALLKAFAKHSVLSTKYKSRTTHSLLNSITFYNQFLPIIEDSIREGRKKLEKEVSDVILLASWKDVNIDALKQSSHRSHNSLYKLVRKYRAILSQAVSSIIEDGLHGTKRPSFGLESLRASSTAGSDSSEVNAVVSTIASWNTRHSSLRNMELSSRNMASHCAAIEAETFPDLTVFADDINREADRLRNETPNVYNKDDKKLLAALKVQKAKVLNDTLKELKRMGLKTGFREDIRKVQESVTSILSCTDTFEDSPLQGCDAQYYRILELAPRLRFVASSPANDAPLPALEKGMAISENLLFLLITSRSAFREFADNFTKVTELREELEQVSCSKDALMHKSLVMDYDMFIHISKWLPELMRYALETLDLTRQGPESSSQSKVLSDGIERVAAFKILANDKKIYDGSVSDILKDFGMFCDNLVVSLSESCSTKTAFISQAIIEWLHTQKSSKNPSHDLENSNEVESIDCAFRKINTSIMLTIQKLLEDQPVELTMEDDNWLLASHKRIMNTTKKVISARVTSNLENALQLIKSQNFSKQESKLISAVVQFTMPMISRYHQLLVSLINKHKVYYDSLSHGTFTLESILYNLAKNGFCSPSPPDEETENQNLQDGTGLGDGEGAQNNSKDVEEDEDLLEDAQKPNKDQNKDEDQDDKDDDAVDMEGDMAGDLENASGGDDDDEEKDDSEEEEELDEEVDDLDEDDPNAIDEKMWNEEAQDSNKEKKADEAPQNSTEDDVQAAEGDNDEKSTKDNETKDEPENSDHNEDEKDNDQQSGSESEEEDETAGQDDEVKNDDGAELENNVPDVETMDLPDDMNLDSGDEESGTSGSEADSGDESGAEEQEETDEAGTNNAPEEDQDISLEDDEDNAVDDALDGSENSNDDDDAEENSETANQEENVENLDSDHELADDDAATGEDKQDEENDLKEKGGEENSEDKLEGLDGADDMMDIDNDDFESTVQQQSGSRGQGADATNDEEEEENIGSFGNAQQEQQEKSEEDVNESSRQEAKESLKQLGDSLKEFHRRHQEINEASNRDEDTQEDSTANERPDEFEHVDGAKTDTDTQALGSASKDNTTAIDEDKAIDDDIDMDDIENENNKPEELEGEDEANLTEEQRPAEQPQDRDSQGKSKGTVSEERSDIGEQNPFTNSDVFDAHENDLDEIIDAIDQKVTIEESTAEPPRSLEEARQLWRKSETETAELSAMLGEQLRLILEPTLATKLKGDYKTGKRLNMKRIIPYIASQFRKDKIWLRRTKPSKRQYQIMIAVDDSKSMSESKSVDLAFQSICLVSKALTQLESGGLSIVKFGDTTQEVHQFDKPFSVDSGAKIFQWFDFQETRTDVKKLVAESIRIFDRGRSFNNADLWQLQIIISDGVCEDHDTIQRLVRRARENKIMLVFVIVDGINSSESIMDMSQVKYVPDKFGNVQLKVEKYLDTFPFEFYVVVHDISELPEMLSVILRQYFSELAST
ncbi:LANO_0C07162g1_1 [Lachancea nothofagi CBS 11611]|uniref:Midasin n=1 Tax=Lachancea nothofagi CBS 11611 TaxID=1266666 RepID=A0A1G4J8D2_9SACH|nr:LANO_0C07162g1_1 [Lachancea nothofagi CBS 11611]